MSDRETSGNDDLSLPKATVQKIVSEIIPSDLAFAKDTRDVLIECCIEFIMMLSTESNEIAEKESKKTIAPEHVIKALQELGFMDYIEPIKDLIVEHKEALKSREKKVGKLEQSGMTEEELLRKQEEMFAAARSKLNNNA
ncbi:Negative cofactor 2 complex subunit beta [Yarrowia sp. C11]|nr:Negative cofactor 2 complex subunit beta [Yarrowia sp. C11]KAG5365727.1 Negative cofactor 2 complex subunit beta [Yarrowia sp. B02]KAG5370483.1 Negative cofactor 2 complex subunit beta [Yarrowia sp. E02]